MSKHWSADDWHKYLSEFLDARANFPNGLNTVALAISDAINALLGRNGHLVDALKQMEGFALTPPLRRLVDGALKEGEEANDYNKLLTSWAECRDLLSEERAITCALVGALRGIETYSNDLAMTNAARAAIDAAILTVPLTGDIPITRQMRDQPAGGNPGGMYCDECFNVFIGAEWHERCALCEAKMATAFPSQERQQS